MTSTLKGGGRKSCTIVAVLTKIGHDFYPIKLIHMDTLMSQSSLKLDMTSTYGRFRHRQSREWSQSSLKLDMTSTDIIGDFVKEEGRSPH